MLKKIQNHNPTNRFPFITLLVTGKNVYFHAVTTGIISSESWGLIFALGGKKT